MHEKTLQWMRDAVRDRRYVMTTHAEEEMDAEDLSIYDIESGILTGKIAERQKDRVTGEWKYRIRSRTMGDKAIEIMTKKGPTRKVVIITVYSL